MAFAALSFVGSASAEPTIYEPFTYPEGDTQLNGNTGGTGLSGNWSADNNHNDNGGTGLTWGSLETQGAAAKIENGWSDGEIGVDTSTSYNSLLADGGELWFSMIYDNTVNNQRSMFALSTLGVVGNGRLADHTETEDSLGIGFGRTSDGNFYSKIWDDENPTNGTKPEWGASNSLQSAPQYNVLASNNEAPVGTAFVVGHVQWGASDTDLDRIDLYLPGTDLDLGSVVSRSEGTIADQSGLDVLSLSSLESADGADYSIYDEIRVGASYDDVSPVPEPSSFALIGGFLALTSVMLRRRRS